MGNPLQKFGMRLHSTAMVAKEQCLRRGAFQVAWNWKA